MTQYRECMRESHYEGETIVPMTESEAYEWLESVGAVTAIEKHFQDLLEEA